MRFSLIIFTVLFLCSAVNLTAGGNAESGAADGSGTASFSPVSVTDVIGRTVTIEKPVQRVAYVHAGSAEALKILNAWDMVVAKDGYVHDEFLYPGSGSDIPPLVSTMGNPYEPNMELLLSLNVDLLILESIPMPGMDALMESLEGIMPVYAAKMYAPEHIEQDLTNLGLLLDRREEAAEYLEWYKDVLGRLAAGTADMPEEEKVNLLFAFGTGGSMDVIGSFSDALSYIPYRNRIVGCRNVVGDIPSQGGYIPAVDPEWLISQDVDVLIIGDALPNMYGALKTDMEPIISHRSTVLERPVFRNSDAVKNNRVFMLGDGLLGTPRFIIGFAYQTKWCHPELFADLNPRDLHEEYLNRFMRVDINLRETGVFVYPES